MSWMKGFDVQYPFVDVSPFVGSSLLASLSFGFMIFTGLAVGGMVYALAAQVRGRRSIDPRWEQLSRATSSGVLNIMLFGVSLFGSLLWLAQTVLRPKAAEEFQKIFQVPMRYAWLVLLLGLVLLFLHSGRWNRLRSSFPAHFGVGSLAAVALFAVSALPVSIASFSMTPGFWHNTRSAWDAFLNPSFAAAYLVWGSYSLAVSGGAGLVYAALQKDDLWRSSLVGWLGVWTAVASIAGAVFTSIWVFVLFFRVAASVVPGVLTAALAVILSAFLIWVVVRRSEGFSLVLSVITAIALLTQGVGIYRIRAHLEGPFSIQGYLFRNGILISEIGEFSVSGLWRPAPWWRNEPPLSGVALGSFIFRAQCYSCHSKWLGKGGFPISNALRYEGDTLSFLSDFSSRHPQLPVFAGNGREKKSTARYIEKLIRDSGVSLSSQPPKSVPTVKVKTKSTPPSLKKNATPRNPVSLSVPGDSPVEANPASAKPAWPAGKSGNSSKGLAKNSRAPVKNLLPNAPPKEKNKSLVSGEGKNKKPMRSVVKDEKSRKSANRTAPNLEGEKP